MGGPEKKSGIDLYVRRVLITHECARKLGCRLYLRFVKGVVDSADPSAQRLGAKRCNTIRCWPKSARTLVNRILKTLEEMKSVRVRDISQVLLQGIRPLPEGKASARIGPAIADALAGSALV